MLRKGNVVPKSEKTFHPLKHLARGSFIIGKDVIVVKLRWSKTIQFGQRSLVLPLIKFPGSEVCPVTAIRRLFSMVDAPTNAPAFSYGRGDLLETWTEFSWTKYVRRKLSDINLDGNSFSEHSLRRGGSTFAFNARVPSELIQLQGDWRSDAYKQYLHCNMQDKLKLALIMKSKLLDHI